MAIQPGLGTTLFSLKFSAVTADQHDFLKQPLKGMWLELIYSP